MIMANESSSNSIWIVYVPVELIIGESYKGDTDSFTLPEMELV